jgi:U3 small nucleolar ribonucleoprotein protein IMP4
MWLPFLPAEGKPIPSELRHDEGQLRKEIELEDDNTAVVRTHIDDEYAHAGEIDPKTLITTSRDPSSRLTQFSKVRHALDAACWCRSCVETSR